MQDQINRAQNQMTAIKMRLQNILQQLKRRQENLETDMERKKAEIEEKVFSGACIVSRKTRNGNEAII